MTKQRPYLAEHYPELLTSPTWLALVKKTMSPFAEISQAP